MLQGYTYTQALRMYRKYGVRVAVPCSAVALRKARARTANNMQGVCEMGTNVHTVPRLMYQTVQQHTAMVLQLATAMRASA